MVRLLDIYNITPRYLLGLEQEVSEDKLVLYLAALTEVARMEDETFEESRLGEYVISSLGLGDELLEKARKLIAEQSPSFGDIVRNIEEPELRICILRDCYAIAMMDKKVDHTELLALERLAGALGISRGLAKKITDSVDLLADFSKEIDSMKK